MGQSARGDVGGILHDIHASSTTAQNLSAQAPFRAGRYASAMARSKRHPLRSLSDAPGDSVCQGHLAPAAEYPELRRALLRHAGPHIKHGWLSISGAIANENALKIVLQKHAPADKIVAFARNFAGRTLALAEITDKA